MKQIVKLNNKVSLVSASIPQIGYVARTFTPGKELDMVSGFVDDFSKNLGKNTTDKTVIFLEPAIDTGYPDIVMVTYKPIKEYLLKRKSIQLTNQHFKVLFEIDRRKQIKRNSLESYLGYDRCELNKILTDLQQSGLIACDIDAVKRIPYKEYYCVKKIVAIEAKLDKWTEAMNQAVQNTRFSNESYILMNKRKCSNSNKERCLDLGIGVFLMDESFKCIVKSRKNSMPGSYLSFLYNNWVTQIEMMEFET